MQLTNLFRRHKWRLRPLKRLVLPARHFKRFAARLLRHLPTIESVRQYRGESFCTVTEIYGPEQVSPLLHPFAAEQSIPVITSEPASIYEFQNIEFWGRYGGSVVTADNRLLAELSPEVWGIENHPLFSRLMLPRRRELRGQTAISVTPEAIGNYYHWLIDLVPRVALIQFQRPDFDQLLINGSHAAYEQASLAALQIPPEKIRYVDTRDRFRIEKTTIPSMDHASKTVARWKIDLLRKLRDSISPAVNLPDRLYISRRRAVVRRVINEAEFERVLRAADFSIVEPESLPWEKQVALFANAKVILAPHGAALANIGFCKPGTVVIEIATRTGYKDFYLLLAAAAELDYRFIEARSRVAANASPLRALENEDMMVDPDAIQKFIEAL